MRRICGFCCLDRSLFLNLPPLSPRHLALEQEILSPGGVRLVRRGSWPPRHSRLDSRTLAEAAHDRQIPLEAPVEVRFEPQFVGSVARFLGGLESPESRR